MMKMDYKIKGTGIVAILVMVTGILSVQGQDKNTSGDRPRNVILMIGDGMGLSQVSSPYYFSEEEPAFSRFRYIGLARTSSGDAPVTQSPAAATALSTGFKTYNMAVGVDMDTIVRENIAEVLAGEK